MGNLQQRLQDADPELYGALQRSWKIAQEDWLPAIGAPTGSYNSAPHLRNMENHLDQIVTGFEAISAHEGVMQLRAVELYVLLASVLFHDLGRLEVSSQVGHAAGTRKRIERKYAHLGIPSSELARAIAAICSYHDLGGGGSQPTFQAAERELADILIDPYGPIRQRSLAALLALADHMDSAYTRVLPQYVKPPRDLDVVGLFRSLVRGVHVDHDSRMVRTVLSDDFLTNPGFHDLFTAGKHGTSWGASRPYTRVDTSLFRQTSRSRFLEQLDVNSITDISVAKKEFRQEFYGDCRNVARVRMPYPLPERLRMTAEAKGGVTEGWGPLYGFEGRDWLLAWRLTRLEDGAAREGLPPCTPLALAMADVRRNSDVLKAIQDSLALIGMPIWGWRIDYAEHLYDEWGLETSEPILDADYLSRLVYGMWSLSTGIFGESVLSYPDLASAVGEPDSAKTRTAVRRIAVVTRGVWESTRNKQGRSRWSREPPIWAGDTHWRWNVFPGRNGRDCSFATLEQVRRAIDFTRAK